MALLAHRPPAGPLRISGAQVTKVILRILRVNLVPFLSHHCISWLHVFIHFFLAMLNFLPNWVEFFSLLNCNTQIGTPTWGLRKPLLPCQTAYARVTFYEVPTRLPPRKLLQRSLYLTWCGHHSGSEEEEELEDDDFLDNLWKEGGNLIKRGALCHGK